MPSLNETTNGPGVGDPSQRLEPDYEANAEPVVGDVDSKPIANSPAPEEVPSEDEVDEDPEA